MEDEDKGDEDEEDEDTLATEQAELKHAWEAPRPAIDDSDDAGPASSDSDDDQPMEEAACPRVPIANSQEPIAVHFTYGRAGQPLTQTTLAAYADYQSDLGTAANDNIYTPFHSKMDYEVACWMQLCGPGFTAFTELLQIEGVSLHHSISARHVFI